MQKIEGELARGPEEAGGAPGAARDVVEGARGRTAAARLRAQRAACLLIFLANGFCMGTWVTRIPDFKRALALSEATLGNVLLAPALGAFVGMPLAGWLVAHLGSRVVAVSAGAAFAISLFGPGFARTPVELFLVLTFFGVSNGVMDVSMNANAAEVEEAWGRPIMSSFHALYSAGGLAGAAAGGALAHVGVAPAAHLSLAAVAALLLVGLLSPWVRPGVPAPEPPRNPFALPPRAMWPLCAIAFLCMFGEGAMADWSAVYLRETLGTTAAFAATGFAAFSVAMAAGRFLGDGVSSRLGPVAVVRGGAVLVTVGLAAALVIGRPIAGLFGFACVGLGLSCVIPTVFSAAARSGPTGTSIAAVATFGYLAFLGGPPVVGHIAAATSLPFALSLIVVGAIAIVVLAGAAGGPAKAAQGEESVAGEGVET
ncbi:MFS transporter [Sorangium sp. So ce296]|uniref:MFS transporter n=1 Tax=Sorangium sp. So ce296 TaxID=3133296 RepID=UPI003F60F840